MVRHLITIDDLTEGEIQAIFRVADEFLKDLADPQIPHRVRGSKSDAQGCILATLFYEASTRTRFSFESAMYRLGGQVLSSADPKTTSAAKGETIADTVRVLQNYADVIVIRHPCEGAVRVAADYADVPIINAGDGGHEHPTQTLCDLYTLQREKGTLKDLNVLLWGDLRNGRTVHSLVYGLARFGARIIPMPAEGFGLPEHVIRRLAQDYGCTPLSNDEVSRVRGDKFPVDAVYVTPEKPHQRSLFSDVPEKGSEVLKVRLPPNALAKIDACYVTRLQRERLPEGQTGADSYPVIDAAFLKDRRFRSSSVMHPLPRVEELGYDLDNDERAVYFKQAAYGVPVRMALIAALLRIRPDQLGQGPPAKKHRVYSQGTLGCENTRCVTGLSSEQRYLEPRFLIIPESDRLLARCVYCEHDMIPEFVGRQSTRKFEPNRRAFTDIPDDLLLFADEEAALRRGCSPVRQKVEG
jgi:aspartate carbamoyltransferase catalytic subunit